MARIQPAPKSSAPPCPLCGSTRGRTFLSEERVLAGDGPIHQTVATTRKYRCFGCGRQYVERPESK